MPPFRRFFGVSQGNLMQLRYTMYATLLLAPRTHCSQQPARSYHGRWFLVILGYGLSHRPHGATELRKSGSTPRMMERTAPIPDSDIALLPNQYSCRDHPVAFVLSWSLRFAAKTAEKWALIMITLNVCRPGADCAHY
ncbi:uncharacterized protein BDV17DRAFT_100331 [Aspergillus undulatus]|uniref:uncharacterized protein n=1 Tax=Aspergillus undulatus TaxID=1810928 RepID=UPI003CCD5EAE